MGIFLHFMNREIYRAANADFPSAQIFRCARILTIGKAERLFSNFSNILEGGFLDATAPMLFRELIARSQLLIAGERPSLREFIESRIARYHFDADRYPMYFRKEIPSLAVQPIYIRQASITDHLQREIGALEQREKSVSDLSISPADASSMREALPQLNRFIIERESRAITRSLFAGRLQSQQQESASARVISTLYVKQYLEELDCEIATGIPQLAAFEHLGTGLYGNDLPVLECILSACGFTGELGIGQDRNDSLFASLRNSDAQVTFSDGVDLLSRALKRYFASTTLQFGRYSVQLLISRLRRQSRPLEPRSDVYSAANERVAFITSELRTTDIEFAESYEREMTDEGKNPLVRTRPRNPC